MNVIQFQLLPDCTKGRVLKLSWLHPLFNINLVFHLVRDQVNLVSTYFGQNRILPIWKAFPKTLFIEFYKLLQCHSDLFLMTTSFFNWFNLLCAFFAFTASYLPLLEVDSTNFVALFFSFYVKNSLVSIISTISWVSIEKSS